MEKELILERETVVIEGGRNLYSYTFEEVEPAEEPDRAGSED